MISDPVIHHSRDCLHTPDFVSIQPMTDEMLIVSMVHQ